MGNLTDDMTRLRGEVDALRNARGVLMQDLAQGARNLAGEVFAMRVGFAETHATMTRKAKGERRAFVSGITSTVSSLLDDFSTTREAMAWNTRLVRRKFVSNVKQTVGLLLKDTAEDLAGVRRVWRGPTAAEKQAAKDLEMREEKRREAEARRQKAEQMRQEAEAFRLKEEQSQREAVAKRQEEEQRRLVAAAAARKLKEEKLQREAEAKRQEKERQLALVAAATNKETEGRQIKVSAKSPEGKAKPSPTSRKGKK